MKKFVVTLLLMAGLISCARSEVGGMSENGNNVKTVEQIKQELTKNVPGLTRVDAVNKSGVPGIYEVVIGRKIFYVTMDGKYLFFGNLVDVDAKASITEKRTQELSKIDVSQLPLDVAIKSVYGNGKNVLYVFSDPECPYCQMFEQQVVSKLNDVTIYTFLFPLPMHKNALNYSKQIWCSKDRAKSWSDWMVNKKPLPKDMSCDTSAIDKSIKVGSDVVGVEGTPTIILSNGQILPGLLPVEQLTIEMEKASKDRESDVSALVGHKN